MEIRSVDDRNTAVVRTSTPVEKLSEVMGSCFGEIMGVLGTAGVAPAGPPFAMYHNMDMSKLDVEIGFPVASRIEASGRVKPGKIPGGKAAVTLHRGPYDKIEDAYNRLSAFVRDQGLDVEGFTYEFYLNDPDETPPEELKTEIYFPVKG